MMRRVFLGLWILVISPVHAGAEPDSLGIVSGIVVSKEDGLALKNASVIVRGKALGASTKGTGQFRIDRVPIGRQTLRVMMVGRKRVDLEVTVLPGENPLGTIPLEFQAIRIADDGPPVQPYRGGTVGSLVRGIEDQIACIVRIPEPEPTVGDRLQIDVRLYNLSRVETVLPLGRAGCDEFGSAGAQYPKIWIKVDGPPEGFVVEANGGLSETTELQIRDLPAVKPGDGIDPLRRGWRPRDLASGRFKKPGKYRVTFHYSTYESKASQWFEEANSESANALTQRLSRVPLVRVEDSVSFVVRN